MTNADPAPSPFSSSGDRAALRARKREAILVAAVRMFNERGYHATSLDDVAAQLGVSKPLVYHYLGNKEQVLLQCVQRGVEDLGAVFENAKAQPGTGLDRLHQYLIGYGVVILADFGRCVVRTGDEVLSPDNRAAFRADKRKIDQHLRTLVRAAQTDGSAVVEDERLTAFALAGGLNWAARWQREDGAMSARSVAQGLARSLVEGLRPRD